MLGRASAEAPESSATGPTLWAVPCRPMAQMLTMSGRSGLINVGQWSTPSQILLTFALCRAWPGCPAQFTTLSGTLIFGRSLGRY